MVHFDKRNDIRFKVTSRCCGLYMLKAKKKQNEGHVILFHAKSAYDLK